MLLDFSLLVAKIVTVWLLHPDTSTLIPEKKDANRQFFVVLFYLRNFRKSC